MNYWSFVASLLQWLCGTRSERDEEFTPASDVLDSDHGPADAGTVNGRGKQLSSSSSTSELPLHQHKVKYDIFVNHRGPDTKLNFVTHLEDALKEKQYVAFVDRSMKEGEHAFEAITCAIQDTRVHLAIFSPGYTQSEYCLDELAEMVECSEKNANVILLPVFYDVKPGDLRRLDFAGDPRHGPPSPFQEAFQKQLEKGRFSEERISRWRNALCFASKVKGFELSRFAGDTNELKNKIVQQVQQEIQPRSGLGREQPVLEPTVGFQVQRGGILKRLEEVGDTVAILGICGMGGIGKTTLAQEIYNHYSKNRAFQYYTFLNFEHHGLTDVGHLKQQALRDLLNKKEKNVVERYVAHFEEISELKVLVVMDNISTVAQFKELIPNMKLLGPGSRIILTSRERDTLNAVTEDAPARFVSYLHEMQGLNPTDSFELFWFHAFRNKEVPRERDAVFRPLARKVVDKCWGLPLALKIIGQHLLGKKEEVWEDATISMQDRPGIIDVLSISYKGLERDCDKMMFLDVSCQMVGLLEEEAIDIWRSCAPCRPWYCMTSKMVHDSLQILKDKSLVEVDKDKRLTMHDLLREMGRKMGVLDVKPYLLPCHLWDPKQAKEILDELDEGGKEIRGLSLAGLQCEEEIDASKFQRMSEIHLMQLDGARIGGDFSLMSKKLRWLQWTSSFLTSLPPQLRLQNLAILDLSNSSSLTRLWSDGDTQAVPKLLRVLRLQNCTALEEVPETIEFLTMLRTLDLQGCKRLRLLPRSLGELKRLQDLSLNDCEHLECLPDSIVTLSNLKAFSMNNCKMITDLPLEFGNLGALVKFSAQGASSLTCLPKSFSQLTCLEELWLLNCPAFSELPNSVKGLRKLRIIHANNTGLKQLPHDFGELDSLVECHLNENNFLEGLPESFGKLRLLEFLSLIKCRNLRTLPSNFGELQSLTALNLEACPIEDGDLPVNFGRLKRLQTLTMKQAKMTTLPEGFRELTALALFDVQESPDLADVEALPAFLEELELGNCPKLIRVDLKAKGTKLRKLILNNCTGLTEVQGLEYMQNLQEINVSGCSGLSSTDRDVVFLTSVVKECHLSGSGVSLKYNNNWSQDGAPSFQLVSYYDHTVGFIENTMTRKISSMEWANEVCVETSVTMADDQSQVEAVVITVVAHDQGFSDFPWDHGKYNGSCFFEARIVRGNIGETPVFTSSLFTLRHADHRDQVYICTLRDSHPLVTRLRDGDRICVIARSLYPGWRITVMQGNVCVAYKPDLKVSEAFRDLYLKDGFSSKFRSDRFPHILRQAFTEPSLVQLSHSHGDGPPAPNSALIRRVVWQVQSDPTALSFHLVCSCIQRVCDICETPIISSQRGWHCNTCTNFDMCQTCYTNLENVTRELPPPHRSDHSMSEFEAPEAHENKGILMMPYERGVDGTNWGYVFYDYPNVRWSETIDLIR